VKRLGAFRQILIVLLVAIAAITIGRALRSAVDQSNAPTPAPTSAVSVQLG
jgi:hypothetical protein